MLFGFLIATNALFPANQYSVSIEVDSDSPNCNMNSSTNEVGISIDGYGDYTLGAGWFTDWTLYIQATLGNWIGIADEVASGTTTYEECWGASGRLSVSLPNPPSSYYQGIRTCVGTVTVNWVEVHENSSSVGYTNFIW
jgi:hypothetical protein